MKENESLKRRYKKTSKLINGYDQTNSMERALGFSDPYHLQQAIHPMSNLINASDVVEVCYWLLDHGYDVKIPKDKLAVK